MAKTFRFTVDGMGARGQSWTTTGTVDCEFHLAFEKVMIASFNQLTKGEAIYGMPGVGCSGPYDIHKLVIEQIKP